MTTEVTVLGHVIHTAEGKVWYRLSLSNDGEHPSGVLLDVPPDLAAELGQALMQFARQRSDTVIEPARWRFPRNVIAVRAQNVIALDEHVTRVHDD